ncbi:MAG: hypothetical protein RIR70_1182, partial [Pseudomonadota bacterium]
TSASHGTHQVFIGLGANLGEPRQRVLLALEALAANPALRLMARSSLYASAPVGVIAQPDFINAVALIETSLGAESLLAALLEEERRAGRVRAERYGPRVLDIDILLFDDQLIESETLTVPHPRMHERSFVLQPLLEIAPEVVIPGKGPAAEWLARVTDQRCVRLPA